MSAARESLCADVFTRDEILAALTIEPCHITGMHDPSHTAKYICRDQLAEAMGRLLALLDTTKEDLPRRLGEDCGWCQRDSEEGPLLAAWADRRPMTFRLHGDVMGKSAPIEGEEFPTYEQAWDRGFALRKASGLYEFSISVTFDGQPEPRRIGWCSR